MDYDALYRSVIQQESGGNANAQSPVGALGLMQVMPKTAMDPGYGLPDIFETAEELGFRPGSRDQATAEQLLRDPRINEVFGKRYLNRLIRENGGDVRRALAAYNWGQGNVNDWNGDPSRLPDETQGYLNSIGAMYARETGEDLPGVAPAAPGISLRPQARPEEAPASPAALLQQLGGTREARRRLVTEAAQSGKLMPAAQYAPQRDTSPMSGRTMAGIQSLFGGKV